MAIYTRMQQKHDIEANWIKAKNFIPLEGEIIIYDADENYSYQRIKIGDGITKVKDLPFDNIQGDWSQNDETASDYVKNRTHYIETPQGKNVLECSIASHFTWGADSSPNLSAHGVSVNMPAVGEIMHAVVTFNGISRRFSGTLLKNSFDEMWIGDASKLSGVRYPGNEGEFDFAFVVAPPSYFECYFPVEGFGTIAEGDIVNIHLYTGDPTVIIHQLDEKYIPDTIARVSDIAEQVQPDWNQNDETSPDYIKNRTHYEATILGPSTLSIEDSAEEFTGDSNDYHIYCSMPDEYKYQSDCDEYYVEFWMSKLNTKLDVHSELNVLGISGETYSSKSSSTTEIRRVQGKNYTLYYARDDWESEPDEEGATSAITRISDGVIIAADEPCTVSIRCGYSNPAGYWEGFVEINIPSAGIWISRGITATLEPTVKYVCHKLDDKFIPDTIARKTDVETAVNSLVDTAPDALNTLNELSKALGDDPNFSTTVLTEIGKKVDKVNGKGLSTNDYTTTEKNKLAGIAAGAEKNVQADWNQNDETAPDYIKNKTHYRETKSVTRTNMYGYYSYSGDSIRVTATQGEYGTDLYTEFWMHRQWLPNNVSILNVDHKTFNIASITYDTLNQEYDGMSIRMAHKITNDYTLFYNYYMDYSVGECKRLGNGVAILAVNPCTVEIDFHKYNPAETAEGIIEINIPSPGLWVAEDIQLNNVTLGIYDYHTLDEKYIPDTIARVTDIPEVTHGTFLDFEPYYIFDGREFNFTSNTITIYPEDPENSYSEDTASVVWDGVLYDALPLTAPDSGHVYSGEVFSINFDRTDRPDGTYGTVIYVYSETLGVHTIKLYNPSKKIETVKQLDEKYIPDTIARKDELSSIKALVKDLEPIDLLAKLNIQGQYVKDYPLTDLEFITLLQNKIQNYTQEELFNLFDYFYNKYKNLKIMPVFKIVPDEQFNFSRYTRLCSTIRVELDSIRSEDGSIVDPEFDLKYYIDLSDNAVLKINFNYMLSKKNANGTFSDIPWNNLNSSNGIMTITFELLPKSSGPVSPEQIATYAQEQIITPALTEEVY